MLTLVKVCPCGSVADRTIAINKKQLDVCAECETKAQIKAMKMSIMVEQGTPPYITDKWS